MMEIWYNLDPSDSVQLSPKTDLLLEFRVSKRAFDALILSGKEKSHDLGIAVEQLSAPSIIYYWRFFRVYDNAM